MNYDELTVVDTSELVDTGIYLRTLAYFIILKSSYFAQSGKYRLGKIFNIITQCSLYMQLTS